MIHRTLATQPKSWAEWAWTRRVSKNFMAREMNSRNREYDDLIEVPATIVARSGGAVNDSMPQHWERCRQNLDREFRNIDQQQEDLRKAIDEFLRKR